jgi:hypothetical protein
VFEERREEIKLLKEILHQSKEQTFILREIYRRTIHPTPTKISFHEVTMLPTEGGNTLVFTGTLAPAGAEFPTGTIFAVTSNDPDVLPAVDSTGLVVTIPLPIGWVENTTTPLAIQWASSSFTPNPASSPTSLSATITPSAPPPPDALTPTSIVFNQTT